MTDTAVATTEPDNQNVARPPIVVLRERLQARQGELKAALGDIPPEMFIRAVMTSASLNPEILACSWQSIWTSCLQACRDGLLPDGVEGALVPFKGKATWIAMIQGLLRRFRRSGQFRWVTAGLVRQGEEFSHYIDENGEHFRHVPGDSITAPIAKIYALASTKDGGVFVTVIPIAEANKIRAMSRTTREDSPWRSWESEMYKKTALRRLSKMLPSARDLIGEEDYEMLPPALTAAISSPVGIESGDYRASAPNDDSTPVSTGAGGGDEQGSAGNTSRTRVPDGGPAVAESDETVAAYARGKADRAKGMARKALPGELRAAGKEGEATSWLAGWDAEPS